MKTFLSILIGIVITAFPDDYEAWHKKRVESLRSENGWLNLAGLYWLKEGSNSFGSDGANDIIFPAKAPAKLGVFNLKDGKVSLEKAPYTDIQLIDAGSNTNYVFADGKATSMQYGSLRWFVIKRGSKIGIRLRDLEHPILAEFKGIERFPISQDWNIKATFEKPSSAATIAITDVLGQTSQQPLEGYVVFTVNNKTYRLAATDGGDNTLFVIFKDKTAGHETYGAGRFLYPPKPDLQGNLQLDFNKAINPPCAFSPYATCPLPPPQNNLPFRIEAGEKDAKMH